MIGSPAFATRPVDDAARDGRLQMVLGSRGRFVLVRWEGERWVFSSGRQLDFEPTAYRADQDRR